MSTTAVVGGIHSPKATGSTHRANRHRELSLPTAPTPQRASVQALRVLRFMNVSDRSALVPRFPDYTAALDRLRGESFFDAFPELAALRQGADPHGDPLPASGERGTEDVRKSSRQRASQLRDRRGAILFTRVGARAAARRA